MANSEDASMARTIAPLLSLVIAFSPLSAWAQTHCSLQTLKGQYLLSGRGYIEPGDPGVQRVHRGLLVFDGAGNVTGKQSSSRGGKIGHEKLQGTYTLDADCSGTMTFGSVANPGGQIHWDVYVSQSGNAGNMLRTDEGSMAVRSFSRE
jgi:hypothetical protein